MILNVNSMKFLACFLLIIINISCLKFNKKIKNQYTEYSDSLIYFTKNDSTNFKIFNNRFVGDSKLLDAKEIESKFRKIEITLFNKLILDSIANKTTLVKRFNEFHRQVTYFKCKDTQWISMFYLLVQRKSFKVPKGYFDKIVTGVFSPVNCDIFQYQITYNIKNGKYNMDIYHCD